MDFPALPARLASVREVIAACQQRAGHRHAVRIVAVTKTHGPEAVRAAWDAGLLSSAHPPLETTAASIASSLSLPFGQLAAAAEARGDTAEMVRNLERSLQLSPNPALKAAFDAVRGRSLGAPPSLPAR